MTTYLHIDGNAFYASCERVFRPDLAHRPVVVCSNNDGCLVTLTKEAKALGLKRGLPLFKVKAVLDANDVAVFSSNYELYGDMSRRMMQTIASLVPAIEPYSIDECFADVTGVADLTVLADRVRSRVKQWVGIPTCAGIGPTKTLAKLADHFAKKYPAFKGTVNWNDLTPLRQTKALAVTPVGDVWGIGRQTTAALKTMGIVTAKDFRDADTGLIRLRFGVTAERTQQELRGIDCIPFEPKAKPREQLCRSRSFAEECTERAPIEAVLAQHTADAVKTLRNEKCVAADVTVFVLTNHFKADLPQHTIYETVTLITPTDDLGTLTREVLRLFRRGFKAAQNRATELGVTDGFAYKKAGVVFRLEERAGGVQPDLFAAEPENDERRERLMTSLERISKKFGKNAVVTAASRFSEEAAMRREHLSPRYTTRWNELLEVN